jgi:hypothetical protein
VSPLKGNAFPYRPPMPGWAAAALLAPLSFTVRPARDETLEFYLWRLAGANGLNPYHFTSYVKGGEKPKAPIPPDAVIKLSGQPAKSMRYAILELCSPQELLVMNVAGRPRPGSSTGAKCIQCTHARGIYDSVTCWRRTEDVVCLRHRWWTKGARQLNLAGHEEIIAANKLHRQLIRRHGRTAAGNIISEWAERGTYHRRLYDLLGHFHGNSWSVAREDPTAHASMYVPTVALTRLLADAGWKALAFHPQGNAAFVAEIRRTVEPAYSWHPHPYWRYIEPLARTLLKEREIEKLKAEAEPG